MQSGFQKLNKLLSSNIQHKYCTINLLLQKGCIYDRLHNVAQNPGVLVAQPSENPEFVYNIDYPECQSFCQDHIQCNSFTYCPKHRLCYLYDRILHSNEPQHKKDDCFSSYGGDCKHGKYCFILKHNKIFIECIYTYISIYTFSYFWK